MAVGDAHVFPGFLTLVLTQLFFPKPPTTFLTCFCRGERRKYAGKKSRLNRGLNSQPPGHESDTLTTEPPGRGYINYKEIESTKIGSLDGNRTSVILIAGQRSLWRVVVSTSARQAPIFVCSISLFLMC